MTRCERLLLFLFPVHNQPSASPPDETSSAFRIIAPQNLEFSTSECHYGDRHICQLCGEAFSGFSLTTGVTQEYELG
ncbi:hypothetical protein Baya_13685 [Bagarius yarrelli]|uniref:Uncharacterized protein n=1 Tax=Bagarius yarrelli TaxID=175774 RepID=A0A556V6Z2_BAGYA|nr:hypothetical protein Baya_13685 [Bagarius yarrelli]